MARTRTPERAGAIEAAGLEALQGRYPHEWAALGAALADAAARGPGAIAAVVEAAAARAAGWSERVAASHGNPQVVRAAAPHLATARMARLAAERLVLAAAAGATSGTVRFGRWSGALVQRLLFEPGGLVRKPASLTAFRLLWPLVRRRRILMPLVQPRGIWCFYTRELVRRLVALAGGAEVLELGAGDGTLARFLRAAGATVRAVDDGSWRGAAGPPEVERLDARSALARYAPRVVLASFPPPGNAFEARVFETPSVATYVVVATRHRFVAGSWDAYAAAAAAFDGGVDEALSRLVLPPEIDPAVLVFRRR